MATGTTNSARERTTNNGQLLLYGALGGDTAAASRPAGLTFSTTGEFFFTAQSTIQHYDASKNLVQAFTQADGLDHPAQIETDENDTLWVANRDGNNVLRIRTDPANKLIREKVSGITSPRGLAFDRDPNTNEPWLYVADQTEIYRFRVYDTVHVNITVLEEALMSPLSGTVTSKADFEKRVRRDFNQARTIFTQCGIEMLLEGITFVADPNSDSGRVNASSVCTPLPTPEMQMLLGTNRSANPLAINLYYINHFLILGMPIPRNGESITNDCYTSLNNQTGGGVVIARFSALPAGTLTGGAVDNTVAHEIGHFLLDSFMNPVGPGEHRDVGCGTNTNRFHIMHGTGCSTRYTLDPLECTDIRTNMDESEFVELF